MSSTSIPSTTASPSTATSGDATTTGRPENLPSILDTEIPCSPAAFPERPYNFSIRNSATFDVDVMYRDGCEFKTSPNTGPLRPNSRLNVFFVGPNQVYIVRPAGDNRTILGALVYSADIANDTFGKVISSSKPLTTSAPASTESGSAVLGAFAFLLLLPSLRFIIHRRRKKAAEAGASTAPGYGYNKKGELSIGSPTSPNDAAPLGSASLRNNNTLNYTSPNSTSGTLPKSNPTSPTTLADPVIEPGTRLRVIHPHRRDLEDELLLHPGDAVVMIESYGEDGASPVGEEGMIPVGCLDTVPDRSLGRPGANGTVGRQTNGTHHLCRGSQAGTLPKNTGSAPKNSKRVKSLQRPESVALFQAAGRDISQYYNN
ncbi:hypothetical protein BC829DRAFT_402462 [Chytridium lagenaria]|nr:hypothetical protein BC829DRAFT_402462 [Chytridium lagenaria]